jgi:hypothetical protein
MRSGYIPSLTDELIDELAAAAADGPTISRVSLLHWQ